METELKNRFFKARKNAIESEFRNLNEMQRKAVLATEGPLLILAGAGSGKTTVLINRIYNILKYGRASDSEEIPFEVTENILEKLEENEPDSEWYCSLEPAQPWRILAITFTNKAADELKIRLERMLGETAKDIWACTFHSACVRILRRNADLLGFSSNFNIYDTNDSVSLLKHIVKDMELDEKYYAPKALLGEISRVKGMKILPESYASDANLSGDRRRIKTAEIYSEYMRRLHSADAMDFDDLLLFTVILLEENQDVREYWQRRFQYILIDEYQDTNVLQYQMAYLLTGEKRNLCVVGDDDQSIYKFRGATIENILTFEDNFPGCRTIRLEQNYRSTSHILDAANSVIRNNRERKGKELWTANGEGEKLTLYVADNEHDEAQYVASVILGKYTKSGKWRDNAILYRMNAQSNSLEYALKRNGIPYRIIGGMRFFDRAEVKDILSYMNVVESVRDDLRLERIINTPARGIGAKSIETAMRLARENETYLFDIVSRAQVYPELARAAAKMQEFAGLILYLQNFAEVNTPDCIFDEIIEKTGYVRALEEKNTPEDDSRAENVREIKTSILTYMQESGDNTLEGYLANVALYTDLDNYDPAADAVTLMTMHSSKGLEYRNVFLVGMEETIFPGIKSIGDYEEMEEERRLCYVAITRAMESLHIVCARQRMLFGRTTANRASRFIDEIPEEHMTKNLPRGYGYSDSSRHGSYRTPAGNRNDEYVQSGYSSSGYYSDYDSSARNSSGSAGRRGAVTPPGKAAAPVFKPKESMPEPSFSLGDKVMHRAFGEGEIIKMTPMGGDQLIEIRFSTEDGEPLSKKLMLRAASNFMKKI